MSTGESLQQLESRFRRPPGPGKQGRGSLLTLGVLSSLLLAAGAGPLRPGAWAQGLSTPAAPQLPAAARPPAPTPSAAQPTMQPAASGGMVTIESDQQVADNRTGIVTATGNVRITYPERGLKATARQAQYFSREARLVLSGDVDVIDAEGQRIRAERLVYRLDSERLQAEPRPGRQVVSRLRLQSPSPAGPAIRTP